MKQLKCLLVIAAVTVVTLVASSVSVADDIHGEIDVLGYNSGGWGAKDTLGWAFSVNTDVTVTRLGIAGYGTYQEHPIAIWMENDTLPLVSGTILPPYGDISWVDTGGYQYSCIAVTPTLLTPGKTYRIGAFYQPADGPTDLWLCVGPLNAPWTTDPAVNYLGAAFVQADTLANPNPVPGSGFVGFPASCLRPRTLHLRTARCRLRQLRCLRLAMAIARRTAQPA